MNNSTEIKPKKTPGPLRTEAIVPIAIVFALGYIYFHFLFDAHIRKAIEWTASYVHGAEVNVANIQTRFLGGTLKIQGIEVTDKQKPERNLIAINEIRFAFLWDALLRAKFVVNDSGIEGIQLYSPRNKPGYVRPPEPPSDKPSAMSQLESKVLNQTQEELSDNALGDLVSLLQGTDEKELIKNLQTELKSDARIKALQSELKQKESEWKARIDKLPRKDELEALKVRAKALKFDSKNPSQFAEDVKEASKIAKEADAIIDELNDASKTLKGDIDKYNNEFRDLDDLIKQDIADLEKRLKIPNLDLKDFSKNIFGKMFSNQLVNLQKYMAVGRKYMPPPKTADQKSQEELIPPPRGAGKTYRFPVTTGYPLFWLQKASISSQATDEGFSGNVTGLLTDVSTDPEIVPSPLLLDVKGDFPKSEVFGAQLTLTIDHRSEPIEKLALLVQKYPVRDLKLISNTNLGLKLNQAQGATWLNAELKSEQIQVDLKNEFTQTQYDLTAESNSTKEAISSILSGIPAITLNARATGSWDKLNLGLNSNLGTELATGLKKYVQAKIDTMKAEVRAMVDGKVKGEKDKLTQEYKNLKNQIDGLLKNKTSELNKAKSDLKNQSQSQKNSSSDQLKKDLKEKGKKLLKGIKF